MLSGNGKHGRDARNTAALLTNLADRDIGYVQNLCVVMHTQVNSVQKNYKQL